MTLLSIQTISPFLICLNPPTKFAISGKMMSTVRAIAEERDGNQKNPSLICIILRSYSVLLYICWISNTPTYEILLVSFPDWLTVGWTDGRNDGWIKKEKREKRVKKKFSSYNHPSMGTYLHGVIVMVVSSVTIKQYCLPIEQ